MNYEVLQHAESYINVIGERELNLRGNTYTAYRILDTTLYVQQTLKTHYTLEMETLFL